MSVLVVATGAAAVVNLNQYLARIRERVANARVGCLLTETAARFLAPRLLHSLVDELLVGPELPSPWEIAQQYDRVVVLPCTKNLLSAAAAGLAMTPAQSIVAYREDGVTFFPSMNEGIWGLKSTKSQVQTLRMLGHIVVDPVMGPAWIHAEGAMRNDLSLMDPVSAAAVIARQIGA
ncbi:flavoprotein [Microlunatus sp. GCM10028923]|uniref:flavoprotein n=1 Tax=Microlunatus sp. GCM10028923 TaxID=3273400 RepID=UPI00361B8BBF